MYLKKNFCLIFCLFIFLPSISYGKTKLARSYFELGYKWETKRPQQAIKLYEWALQESLKKEPRLQRTAQWRLYHLYLKEDYLLEALFFLEKKKASFIKKRYKKKLSQKLYQKFKEKYSLDKESFSNLKQIFRLAGKKKEKHLLIFLKENWTKEYFYKDLLAFLSKKKEKALVLKALESFGNENLDRKKEISYQINLGFLLLENKKYDMAEDAFFHLLYNSQKLSDAEYKQIYFLLSQMAIHQKDYLQSVEYLKMANQFINKENIYIWLAYVYYLQKKFYKSFNTLKKIKSKKDMQYELLFAFLEAKLKKKKAKLKKLKLYILGKAKYEKSKLALDAISYL